MSSWQPTLSWNDAKIRAELIKNIRLFFEQRDVVEVETPSLCLHGSTDLHLDSFLTSFDHSSISTFTDTVSLHLQTSPEYAMKRLLASGYENIYQICKAYRNEPAGRYHNPEFTMLEWYRLGYDQFLLMREVEELLLRTLNCKPAEYFSYQEIFLKHVGIDPLKADVGLLVNTIKINGKWSDWLNREQDQDTFLQVILSEIIEPTIGVDSPCFIYNFPASQACLAKLSDTDSRVAERFECYYQGVELVNGFSELTSVHEQKVRFEQDNARRKAQGKDEVLLDEYFLQALDSGLPNCSGVALGIDRLMMLAMKKEKISETLTFDINRA